VGLLISFAFGATAIVALDSVGGASPVIYVSFAIALILVAVFQRGAPRQLARLMSRERTTLLLPLVLIYVAATAYFMPRIFAGQAMVVVATRTRVAQVPLEPVAGNVTQTGYFVLGGLCFLALRMLLSNRQALHQALLGLLLLASINAGLGTMDAVGRYLLGADLLEFLRTANFSMMTGVEQTIAGFPRISGAFSETSTFSGLTFALFAFSFVYWRSSGSRFALLLSLVQLVLLLLSTSSTAYGGLCLFFVAALASVALSLVRGKITSAEILILLLVAVGICGLAALKLSGHVFWSDFAELLDASLFNKGQSASAIERSSWNAAGVQAFIDTAGLGVGFGSGRTSSWAVTVLSQTGILGAIMFGSLVLIVARGMIGCQATEASREVISLGRGASALAIGGLVPATIAGSGADPGTLFFISLAIVLACRAELRREAGLRSYVRPLYGLSS
jgi:hypothetical protein